MRKLLSILLILTTISYSNNNSNYSTNDRLEYLQSPKLTPNGDNKVEDTTFILANNITNVEIWCTFLSKNFYLYITNSQIKYVDKRNESKFYLIENINVKNKIINYINMFYIEKTEKIILKKIKRDYIISTDYPFIRTTGFKGKQKIFNKDVHIGEELYDVEYNPIFLEFYELLKSFSL